MPTSSWTWITWFLASYLAELEKALTATDVFLAVIGPRWLELLAERESDGQRDYVREEIAGALQRAVVVIPVLIERTPLPRADELPDDIRGLVRHQKHVCNARAIRPRHCRVDRGHPFCAEGGTGDN
jgi:hypothetical protein